jgi:hypothetical protein
MTPLLLALVCADFPVCTAADDQLVPVVCSANDLYYVFWEDRRFVGQDTTYAVFGARVTPQGNVLDPDGRLIYRWQVRYDLNVASDGNGFLVAFEDSC